MRTRPAAQPDTHVFHHDGQPIAFTVTRARRRTIGLRVHRDGRVSVRAPLRMTGGAVRDWVVQQADWILRQQQAASLRPQPLRYEGGASLPHLGGTLTLRVERGLRNAARRDADTLHVTATRLDEARIRDLVRGWYRQEARRLLAERFAALLPAAAAQGLSHDGAFSLRFMTSRWGSCRHDGAIALNAMLLAAPPECTDYVILHELAHLREQNHGPRFYALLARLDPQWKTRRARLRQVDIRALP